MNGYHPDWVGGLVTGVAMVLSVLVGITMWPQRDRRKRVIVIAVCIGGVLSVAARTVLRHFGI